MRTRTAIAVAVCLLLGAAMQPFAFESGCEPSDPAFWAGIHGIPLDQDECAAIVGGDVRMSLNPDRTKLIVNVIDNEYEARLGRIPPKQVLELDVHNRIVNTTNAPFMPATRDGRELAAAVSTTTKPSPFPEGYWTITAIKPRDDKYGPYFISTNAIGRVEVYENDGAGGQIPIGIFKDLGYALHANTNPFNVSKSYGCLVLRQDDVATLARILEADKQENPKAVQKILVPPSRARMRDW
ncbi:MAG TPA: hypothetical protein DHU26_01365 [Spirochaetaceae bacterium]|nr:hypothetical protein [Spirochaetaceae bacterium]